MGIFRKQKSEAHLPVAAGCAVQTASKASHPFTALNGYTPLGGHNSRIYTSLREGVPIIDSAIEKIVRLIGGFEFKTGSDTLDDELNSFFSMVKVGTGQTGIQCFVDTYIDQLLTYGTAVGEMLYDDDGFYALYNGELDSVDVKRREGTLELDFYNTSSGTPHPIARPERILFSVLSPEPGKLLGKSLLRGLPFVSDILLKIFSAIGSNWERFGNLRYAVTYKPQGDSSDRAFAKERAEQMASAWRDAMSSRDSVKDFVAVGDVKVSVIGADNQVLDSEVPVRQLLEQIIAKTGLMPYMFGLNWSTSERMAKQQCDLLTTELEAYRRIITPVLKKIAGAYLDIKGVYTPVEIEWDDITLQDEVALAQARLYNAQADRQLEQTDTEEGD